jgi:hypothetical protein
MRIRDELPYERTSTETSYLVQWCRQGQSSWYCDEEFDTLKHAEAYVENSQETDKVIRRDPCYEYRIVKETTNSTIIQTIESIY